MRRAALTVAQLFRCKTHGVSNDSFTAVKSETKRIDYSTPEVLYYAPWLGRGISADPAGIDEHLNVFTSSAASLSRT